MTFNFILFDSIYQYLIYKFVYNIFWFLRKHYYWLAFLKLLSHSRARHGRNISIKWRKLQDHWIKYQILSLGTTTSSLISCIWWPINNFCVMILALLPQYIKETRHREEYCECYIGCDYYINRSTWQVQHKQQIPFSFFICCFYLAFMVNRKFYCSCLLPLFYASVYALGELSARNAACNLLG